MKRSEFTAALLGPSAIFSAIALGLPLAAILLSSLTSQSGVGLANYERLAACRTGASD